MKVFLASVGAASAAWTPGTPFGFVNQTDFDFPELPAEIAGEWSILERCGQPAQAGSSKDQRNDIKCPNIILMNTDDMSWADVSINNPSKQMPTPNIDRLVSKGINFRDGHSCTSRCAPSRYCLLSGRYHFRRGDYHYRPMDLEYGRKVLPHLFKRNNYKTMTVGKPQPVEDSLKDPTGTKNYYFEEGTRYWGFDESFSSRSYCCLPGGGYFENDLSVTPFDRYSVFMDFRMEDEKSVQIQPVDEDVFWANQDHWHLLDGYTEDGDPNGNAKPSTFKAYWNMIKNGEKSGLNESRRRRTTDGRRIMRHTHKKRRRRRQVDTEHHVNELMRHRREGGSFIRFQNSKTGQVLIAEHAIQGTYGDRVNYEFGVGQVNFASIEEANVYKAELVAKCWDDGQPASLCNAMDSAPPKKTQLAYDSRLVMKTFRDKSIAMINKHVANENPDIQGHKENNKPFFMYLSWRAPHRPMSHDWEFDPENPTEHMPYVAFGKPGEQLGIFDRYVGDVMRTLEENNIADNTLVLFTSDNGPDGAGFQMLNKLGHMRMSTLRGAKASVYEGGHRVPFLTWWPKGIAKGLHGTNYDLPVSQTDLFATFADILDYPLPGGDQCIYGYDSSNAHVHGRTPANLGRKVTLNCVDEINVSTTVVPTTPTSTLIGSTTAGSTTPTTAPTTAPTSAPTTAPDISNLPGYDWIDKCQKNGKCNAEKCEVPAGSPCTWRSCDECEAFWTAAAEAKTNPNWLPHKLSGYCQGNNVGKKCADASMLGMMRSSTPVCQYTSYAAKGSAEHKKFDYDVLEQWQTHEEQTGFLLGWQGCMAEDSHSFASAFEAVQIDETETHVQFAPNLTTVESKIFAGKLGDLAIRLGRYKLIRYNAPKDIRAGPTRQHLTDHHGADWLTADGDADGEACSYDVDGHSTTSGCSVEPQCRDYSTFGQVFCMRDHFYELWDLEENFGEKVMCDNSKGSSVKNLNVVLENALLENGAWNDRAAPTLTQSGGEKPTDPFGFTLGRELSPVGVNVNDCCLLNYDEKAKWLEENNQGSVTPTNSCDSIKYKDSSGVEKTGGECRPMANMHSFFKSNTEGDFNVFKDDIAAYKAQRANWGWGDAEFAGFAKFDAVNSTTFQFGYGCSKIVESKPAKNTFVMGADGEWRPASMADKFCIPPVEFNHQAASDEEGDGFKVGCKVPTHNGPLKSGWEVNHQWDESLSEDRHAPSASSKNGQLRSDNFGELTEFANCLANVLKMIEGAAYRPETQMNDDFTEVLLDQKPIDDNGSVDGNVSENDDILAGAKIGTSKTHKKYLKTLWAEIAPDEDFDLVGYHGAGSRYFDNTRLAEKCIKYLPTQYPDPSDIKPNFDVDMDLLGFYDSKDQTGGQNTWLKKNGDKFNDDRKVQKYYKKKSGEFLYAFKPQYNL